MYLYIYIYIYIYMNLLRQLEDGKDLVGDLVGQAEDVRVILRESAHPK